MVIQGKQMLSHHCQSQTFCLFTFTTLQILQNKAYFSHKVQNILEFAMKHCVLSISNEMWANFYLCSILNHMAWLIVKCCFSVGFMIHIRSNNKQNYGNDFLTFCTGNDKF